MSNTQSPQGAGKYAYLLSDAAFKVVVCIPENEQLLIEILELLIPGKHIESITFVNKEMHGLVISEKNANFDLLCKDRDSGEEFSGPDAGVRYLSYSGTNGSQGAEGPGRNN